MQDHLLLVLFKRLIASCKGHVWDGDCACEPHHWAQAVHPFPSSFAEYDGNQHGHPLQALVVFVAVLTSADMCFCCCSPPPPRYESWLQSGIVPTHSVDLPEDPKQVNPELWGWYLDVELLVDMSIAYSESHGWA